MISPEANPGSSDADAAKILSIAIAIIVVLAVAIPLGWGMVEQATSLVEAIGGIITALITGLSAVVLGGIVCWLLK